MSLALSIQRSSAFTGRESVAHIYRMLISVAHIYFYYAMDDSMIEVETAVLWIRSLHAVDHAC